MSKIKIFGLNFDNLTYNELAEFIDQTIQEKKNSYIVTCNVDHIVKLKKDSRFSDSYNNADLVVADGVPIVWASKLLKKPLKQKLSGSDFLPMLGSHFEQKRYKLFFLGAAEGVAEKAKLNLQRSFPNLQIVGCYSPPLGFENDDLENDKIINMLRITEPDILFVGLGAPKQEIWISENYKKYRVPVSIGVGGTFDFLSGNVKRAPIFIQKLGLEWFWRLCLNPKRLWRRYLVDDSKFILILIKEFFGKM